MLDKKLNSLIRKWTKMEKEYQKEVRVVWLEGDKFSSRRYEGEAIALHWCIEDLKKLLKEYEK